VEVGALFLTVLVLIDTEQKTRFIGTR